MAQILMMIAMTCQVPNGVGTFNFVNVQTKQLDCQQRLINCIMQKRDDETHMANCFAKRKVK